MGYDGQSRAPSSGERSDRVLECGQPAMRERLTDTRPSKHELQREKWRRRSIGTAAEGRWRAFQHMCTHRSLAIAGALLIIVSPHAGASPFPIAKNPSHQAQRDGFFGVMTS